jgi:hypothetical protein
MAGVLNGTTIGGSIVQMKVGGDTVNMNKSRVATGEMRVSYRMLRLIAAKSDEGERHRTTKATGTSVR